VIHNWGDEIRRFRPGLRHSLYHGPKREIDAQSPASLTETREVILPQKK